MALDEIEKTLLWTNSLAARESDPSAKHRDRLRSALITMRDNVIPFVRGIHRDVLGLTVHDESHLDALWQTADTIAGENFELTPIEAFVFGASILLHDTGLAVAAYPGGLADLRDTTVWRDAEAGIRAYRKGAGDNTLSADEEKSVLFSTLRTLHAEQAEKLVSFTFKRPKRDEAIPLLQDIGLHDALGAAIGRIAHSHHWNASDLPTRLVSVAGAVPGLPTEWTLNELKIACLLRCADAAHIDALRAPTMLYAISPADGASAQHWSFQNKLNSLTRNKDKLVYYAGQSFKVDEAASWWLAYDTMTMIDHELKSSNAILEESGAQSFSAKGVQGIESPRLLSKTVRVDGWTPVSAEVKVSDPVHLARTLGGRNLYGSGVLAPIRELLQNAVDAVRARRIHQGRDENWGKIRLILERLTDEDQSVWLHVDDNGTGMSERVLTGPLIDFGKSFWTSSLMDEEFPGLRSSRPKVVGKFGIGFFSIFLLGDSVRVATRRCDAGESSALVLSFDELTRRPLLRKAATGELPLDFTTRVSVKLNDKSIDQVRNGRILGRNREIPIDLISSLKSLIVAVDVDVEIIDRLSSKFHSHSGNWIETDASIFLGEVCALRDAKVASNLIDIHAKNVRPIVELDGEVVGRAALLLRNEGREGGICPVSVGGFSSSNFSDRYLLWEDHERPTNFGSSSGSMIGVLVGDTSDASRSTATITASKEAIALWAAEQDKLIDPDDYTSPYLVDICHRLIRLGAVPEKLPFGFLGGKFSTTQQFIDSISSSSFVDIPMSSSDYKSTFEFRTISGLNTPFYTMKLHPTVAVVDSNQSGGEFLTEDERRQIVESGRLELSPHQVQQAMRTYPLRYLLSMAKDAWGKDPILVVERVPLTSGNTFSSALRSWSTRLLKP